MTVYTDNADRFAIRPDTAAAWERRSAVREAGQALRAGDRPLALGILQRSVERQSRILLGLQVQLPPTSTTEHHQRRVVLT